MENFSIEKMGDAYFDYLMLRNKFSFLDGIRIGGIENLALTLSNEDMENQQNYLINLNKKLMIT